VIFISLFIASNNIIVLDIIDQLITMRSKVRLSVTLIQLFRETCTRTSMWSMCFKFSFRVLNLSTTAFAIPSENYVSSYSLLSLTWSQWWRFLSLTLECLHTCDWKHPPAFVTRRSCVRKECTSWDRRRILGENSIWQIFSGNLV